MRNLSSVPDSYFDKYQDKKVTIIPFDPKTKIIAAAYILEIKQQLSEFSLEIVHRGSTAFGIAGKGEIEIGIYPRESDWTNVIQLLTNHFGKVDNLEGNYARFNTEYQGVEIEVILMKGYESELDKKLTHYLSSHPKLLKEYEALKYKYCSSKKDYMIQKDRFFRSVISQIPKK